MTAASVATTSVSRARERVGELDLEAAVVGRHGDPIRQIAAQVVDQRPLLGERELDLGAIVAEAADVDVLDLRQPRERALERRELREVGERARVELDTAWEEIA